MMIHVGQMGHFRARSSHECSCLIAFLFNESRKSENGYLFITFCSKFNKVNRDRNTNVRFYMTLKMFDIAIVWREKLKIVPYMRDVVNLMLYLYYKDSKQPWGY